MRKIFHRVTAVSTENRKKVKPTPTPVRLVSRLLPPRDGFSAFPKINRRTVTVRSIFIAIPRACSRATKTWRNHHRGSPRHQQRTHTTHALTFFYVFRCCSANAAHSLSSSLHAHQRATTPSILTLMTPKEKIL